MNGSTFADEIRHPLLDIPRAALYFAREIAYPELDIEVHLRQLDDLAAEARPALVGAESAAQALATFLFEKVGFQGNATKYNDPRNSYLNEVLERRLGIPITLSVVYLAVAERLDIDAFGVNLPGHFVVGVREGLYEQLLDPFHGGMRLTLRDCERLVRETTGFEGLLAPEWLLPANPHLILARMLNNLRIVYVQQGEWAVALAVIERLRQVQPDAPEHLRDLGLIHYQQGDLYTAAQYLEAYLEEAPETADAAAIKENLQPTFSRWARLN